MLSHGRKLSTFPAQRPYQGRRQRPEVDTSWTPSGWRWAVPQLGMSDSEIETRQQLVHGHGQLLGDLKLDFPSADFFQVPEKRLPQRPARTVEAVRARVAELAVGSGTAHCAEERIARQRRGGLHLAPHVRMHRHVTEAVGYVAHLSSVSRKATAVCPARSLRASVSEHGAEPNSMATLLPSVVRSSSTRAWLT